MKSDVVTSYVLPILPCSVRKTLLEFATKVCHLNVESTFYEQTDRVAMAPPVGPVVANILMCYLEEKGVVTGNASPSIWFR